LTYMTQYEDISNAFATQVARVTKATQTLENMSRYAAAKYGAAASVGCSSTTQTNKFGMVVVLSFGSRTEQIRAIIPREYVNDRGCDSRPVYDSRQPGGLGSKYAWLKPARSTSDPKFVEVYTNVFAASESSPSRVRRSRVVRRSPKVLSKPKVNDHKPPLQMVEKGRQDAGAPAKPLSNRERFLASLSLPRPKPRKIVVEDTIPLRNRPLRRCLEKEGCQLSALPRLKLIDAWTKKSLRNEFGTLFKDVPKGTITEWFLEDMKRLVDVREVSQVPLQPPPGGWKERPPMPSTGHLPSQGHSVRRG